GDVRELNRDGFGEGLFASGNAQADGLFIRFDCDQGAAICLDRRAPGVRIDLNYRPDHALDVLLTPTDDLRGAKQDQRRGNHRNDQQSLSHISALSENWFRKASPFIFETSAVMLL